MPGGHTVRRVSCGVGQQGGGRPPTGQQGGGRPPTGQQGGRSGRQNALVSGVFLLACLLLVLALAVQSVFEHTEADAVRTDNGRYLAALGGDLSADPLSLSDSGSLFQMLAKSPDGQIIEYLSPGMPSQAAAALVSRLADEGWQCADDAQSRCLNFSRRNAEGKTTASMLAQVFEFNGQSSILVQLF
ncbi:MAG: hypothetical protein FWF71_03450 [Actinomycetia bacterium]|nr:hypothetical protein [Actinomycetes bacterium]